MRTFEIVCWLGTALMGAFASLRLLSLWGSTGLSAPQYAAEASGILAMVVVPYVFSRAVQGMRSASDSRQPAVPGVES